MIGEDMAETDANKLQKFIIKPNGEVEIEWVNPAFSDVIIALFPEEDRRVKSTDGTNLDEELFGGPRIWCG
jgi:hypothetical protein